MTESTQVRIENDALRLGPASITFQRTMRIPEFGVHPLPPGLGEFPLRRVLDYPDTAPASWLERGGVMLPIYQREAMWLSFGAQEPTALQVGIGKVCAVSGQGWEERVRKEPQNYLALPEQPWLDGINSGKGTIRQFVAVPLGLGATVEGQVTGEETHGGMQLRAVGLTEAALTTWKSRPQMSFLEAPMLACAAPAMGLGAGGQMHQEIYEDERALSDYDEDRSWRVFVHLCSASQWTAITGEVPPPTPVDREEYVDAGLPWFEYYDVDATDVAASETLAGVTPVGKHLGIQEEPFVPVGGSSVVTLKGPKGTILGDGEW